jgi:hypothetical protein
MRVIEGNKEKFFEDLAFVEREQVGYEESDLDDDDGIIYYDESGTPILDLIVMKDTVSFYFRVSNRGYLLAKEQ